MPPAPHSAPPFPPGSGLSLVIPTYNRAGLIRETLEAALNQSQPFERIVVIDDGSTDHTQAVVAPYAPRVSYLRTPNRGVQAARNTGVAQTEGEWVVFCDSDDLLESDFVASVLPWLQENRTIDALYCNFSIFGNEGYVASKFSQAPSGYFAGGREDGSFVVDIPDLYRRTLDFQPLFPTGMVVRRDFYTRIGGYDESLRGMASEDWEFTLRAIAQGRVAVCRRPLSAVRKHGGNDSGDAMRTNLGEALILEYALRKHPLARRWQADFLASVDARRVNAFHAAFAREEFALANQIAAMLKRPPRDLKYFVKRQISRFAPLLQAGEKQPATSTP